MATIYEVTDKIIDKIQQLDLTAEKGYKSGITSLDKIARLDKQQLTVITGKANNGKTTFLDYYMYMLAKNSGLKTLYISFESDIKLHIALLLKYADKEILKSKLLFADTTELNSVEQITQTIKKAKETYNVDNIVIDPFNYITTQTTDTNAICYILKELKQAAKKFNVSIILVAHPRKMQADEQITGESIAGSIHFRNVADNILIISTDFNTHKTTVKVDKLRYNKLQGEINATAVFNYCFDNTYIETEEETDCIFNSISEKVAEQVFKQVTEKKEEEKIDYNALMQTTVSYLNNVTDKESTEKTLEEVLADAENYKEQQAYIRSLTNKETIQSVKRNILAAYTTSVVFNKLGTKKENVIKKNPILCIDVDGQDNNYISTAKMKEIVRSIPSVFYAQESISGKGLFCFVCIKDVSKFKEHFNALQGTFKNAGLTIDAQCNDINRKRYIAYDSSLYINKDAIVYTETKEDVKKTIASQLNHKSDLTPQEIKRQLPEGWAKMADTEKVKYICNTCIENNILLNKTHTDSLKLCSILKKYLSEQEAIYYCTQLRKMRKYVDMDKLKYTFENCNAEKYTVGMLVDMYKAA